MIPVIDVAAVKTRFGVDIELAGNDAVILQAILSAQLRIEGILDTPIARSTRTDLFYVDSSLNQGIIPNGMCRLRTHQAFITAITSIQAGDDRFTLTEIDPKYSLVRNDMLMRGYVTLDGIQFEQKWVQVSYEAGYDDANKADAPAWLQDAIMAFVPNIVKLQLNGQSKEDTLRYLHPGPGDQHAMNVIAPYHRRLGFPIEPVC